MAYVQRPAFAATSIFSLKPFSRFLSILCVSSSSFVWCLLSFSSSCSPFIAVFPYLTPLIYSFHVPPPPLPYHRHHLLRPPRRSNLPLPLFAPSDLLILFPHLFFSASIFIIFLLFPLLPFSIIFCYILFPSPSSLSLPSTRS